MAHKHEEITQKLTIRQIFTKWKKMILSRKSAEMGTGMHAPTKLSKYV